VITAARPRVCLIDDDIFARDAMGLGLSDAGFDVVTAPGAAAGLDIVAREGADAIVTDMHMPGSDGAALIVEARKRWPDLPIIVVTGSMTFGGASVDDVARDLGVNALMVKPFRAHELADKLNALLSRKAD
jgi:DNA-binding response OmpR family regulator